MDRRQRKTREAIFRAFIELLEKKDLSHITVGEIIEAADVGRATFYAHFETKDFLLKELCKELFDHIFISNEGGEHAHRSLFECEAPDSGFLHLLRHLKCNDNGILKLLSCRNNDLFLRYFKENLRELVSCNLSLFAVGRNEKLPEEFRINHISSAFVEAVRWWVERGLKEEPEVIAEYFLSAV